MLDDLLAPEHLLILLLVVVAVWGPQRLPEWGRDAGRALRAFRDALAGPPPEHRSGSR
ncbi:Twin-arginine translocation protein TatA [Candidatus Hydrogenisulfobacillus filiaventi]|uniref:Twin-arginine translocation protein TatA n=1 Tax=Candidatus Hydrogenisulfobacillus filiaventi TaxID=2707344 RepID=A0A6F8ZKK8_9FIRM|nr:twin-arginine translocase TatA/TatE family subunit [Bacillota bacterium]CAB1130142.1 Twin-arginine translocation protein TatA [Candidatus Hydrogenisulfobacillus filiaventi]